MSFLRREGDKVGSSGGGGSPSPKKESKKKKKTTTTTTKKSKKKTKKSLKGDDHGGSEHNSTEAKTTTTTTMTQHQEVDSSLNTHHHHQVALSTNNMSTTSTPHVSTSDDKVDATTISTSASTTESLEAESEMALTQLRQRFARATTEHIQLTFAFHQRNLEATIAALMREGGYEPEGEMNGRDDDDDNNDDDYDDISDSDSDSDEEEECDVDGQMKRIPTQQSIIRNLIQCGMAFAASKGSMDDVLLNLRLQQQQQQQEEEQQQQRDREALNNNSVSDDHNCNVTAESTNEEERNEQGDGAQAEEEQEQEEFRRKREAEEEGKGEEQPVDVKSNEILFRCWKMLLEELSTQVRTVPDITTAPGTNRHAPKKPPTYDVQLQTEYLAKPNDFDFVDEFFVKNAYSHHYVREVRRLAGNPKVTSKFNKRWAKFKSKYGIYTREARPEIAFYGPADHEETSTIMKNGFKRPSVRRMRDDVEEITDLAPSPF